MDTRRGVLKKGLVGGALLAVGGLLSVGLRGPRPGAPPRRPLQLFTPTEHTIFAAVAACVVPPAAPTPTGGRWPSPAEVDCAGKADALLALAHPEVQRDFKRLLSLFESGLFGFVSTARPTPFTHLSPEAQRARIESWRRSRLALLRSGATALVRLVHATYYSSPETYALVGYPGPPEVPKERLP